MSINFEFKISLEKHKFSGFSSANFIVYNNHIECDTFVNLNKVKSFPLCLFSSLDKIPTDKKIKFGFYGPIFRYTSGTRNQFRGRVLNEQKLVEVLEYFKDPVRYYYRGIRYILGKGFMAILTDENTIEIAMCTITDISTENKIIEDLSRVKILVNEGVLNKLPSSLLKAVKVYIASREQQVDLIYTKNIHKYFGYTIKYPTFITLEQRDNYIISLLEDVVPKYEGELVVKEETVETEVTGMQQVIEEIDLEVERIIAEEVRTTLDYWVTVPATDPSTIYTTSTSPVLTVSGNTISSASLTSNP
jgi:hypothetical protein